MMRSIYATVIRLAACGVGLGLSACSSKPVAPTTAQPSASHTPDSTADSNPAPRFALGQVGDPPLFGDAVSLQIVSRKQDASFSRSLAVIGLCPTTGSYHFSGRVKNDSREITISSGFMLTLMRVLDQDGVELSSDSGGIPEIMLSNGLFRTYDTIDRIIAANGLSPSLRSLDQDSQQLWTHASDADLHDIVVGWGSLHAIGASLAENKVFAKMMRDTVQRPSLLSMALGVSVSIVPRTGTIPERTTYTLDGHDSMPAYLIPMSINLNDKPAMYFDMTVVDLRPPLGLSGGVVAIDAWHPTKPDVTLTVRLTGTTRGQPMEDLITYPVQKSASPSTTATPAENEPAPDTPR